MNHTKKLLLDALNKDSTRHDILKELGVISVYLREYEDAWFYFGRMTEICEAQGLDLYHGEKAKIGLVLAKLGMEKESQVYFREYLEYAENDPVMIISNSLYSHNIFIITHGLQLRLFI